MSISMSNCKEYRDFIRTGELKESDYISETGMRLQTILEQVSEGLDRVEAWDIIQIMKRLCTWPISDKKTDILDEILDYAEHLETYEQRKRDIFSRLKIRKRPDYINPDKIIEAFMFDTKGIYVWYTGKAIEYLLEWRRYKSFTDLMWVENYILDLINTINTIERENNEQFISI